MNEATTTERSKGAAPDVEHPTALQLILALLHVIGHAYGQGIRLD